MSASEVLARISDIASASIGDFIQVTKDGWKLSLRQGKRRGKLHTLKKIKAGKDGTEIEVKDSLPALVKLGEYHGLFKNRSEVEHKLVDDDAREDEESDPGLDWWAAQRLRRKGAAPGGAGESGGPGGTPEPGSMGVGGSPQCPE